MWQRGTLHCRPESILPSVLSQVRDSNKHEGSEGFVLPVVLGALLPALR